MRVSEAFPSNYLKASDLQGRNVQVKIDHASYEEMGKEQKLVLYFQGKEKGMVLNKTNANNIAYIYGEEMDDWKGAEIVLFEAMVDFQGKTVPAIRVRAPQRKVAQQSHQAPTPQQRHAEVIPAEMDDEIPF